jgi:hypothetical protein
MIELRVPCELPFPGQETSSAARGRLVVVSTDPELIRELNQLRSEANPDNATPIPPATITRRDFKWRHVRLESDMVKVQMQTQDRPGGPGGREAMSIPDN